MIFQLCYWNFDRCINWHAVNLKKGWADVFQIYPNAIHFLVSFAAVIRVVTHRSSPLTAAHSSSTFLSPNWPIRSRLPFSGNLVFGGNCNEKYDLRAASNASMLLVLGNKGKRMQRSSEQPLVARTPITAAKETIHFHALRFCPSTSLLVFPVFCSSSSIVLSRYFDI